MGSKNNSSKHRKREVDEAAKGKQDNGYRHGCASKKVVVTDSRFASVHSDPRFARLPKQKSKVAIDSRFDRMFTDKNFTSSSAEIDKRGKPKKKSKQNPLKHYYRREEEEEEQERRGKEEERVEKSKVESDEASEESESEGDVEELKRLKGEAEASESEDEEDDDEDEDAESEGSSTDTTDSDDEYDVYSMEDDTFIKEENVPEIDKETHRLAVVNLDWNNVRAVDLFVLLSSFLPKGGQISSAAVYPSEFGLKRMEEEAVHGPIGLFDDDTEQNESDDDAEIDNEKLRAYELSRLRYYYAVVECDSIATADYLYKVCDGLEFERSSNKLDLRFIPDSMELKHPPRDVATEAPSNYEGVDFHSRALQLSKIELTWDEDEPQRAKTLKRKFNAEQVADLELEEFLASDESETDDDGNEDTGEDQPGKKRKKQDMYRALLQSGEGSEDDNVETGQDMEVTFNTGLEELSKKHLEKKDKKSETVWEAYLRKRKEKKKARKNRSKNSSDDESSESDEEPREDMDDFFIEESGKGSKEAKSKVDRKDKKHKEATKETEASRAELELLLADDGEADTNLKGYNMKPKKAKGKGKGKNIKEIADEGKIPTINYEDPRFSSLFTSPLFALDPTDPQFKRSAAYARQLAQKQRKDDQEEMGAKQRKESSGPTWLPTESVEADKNENLRSEVPSKKEKFELSSLVKSIKVKSQQVRLPPNSKPSGRNK